MKMARILVALALVALVVPTSGCASSGATTSVGHVASAATNVELSADAILKAAQAAAQTPNTLKPGTMLVSGRQLDQVAIACDKIGRLGTALASALTDYNATKNSGQNTTALASAIQSMIADAVSALNSIGKIIPNGTVAAIDQAVTAALGVYASLKASTL